MNTSYGRQVWSLVQRQSRVALLNRPTKSGVAVVLPTEVLEPRAAPAATTRMGPALCTTRASLAAAGGAFWSPKSHISLPARWFSSSSSQKRTDPKHQLIGDIAVLSPEADTSGASELLKQSRIRVVAQKTSGCSGALRLQQFRWLAGEDRLHTKHNEQGVKLKLDLTKCFFNPKLQTERQRLCGLVEPDERILVLYSGAGVWPIIFAAKTSCKEVVGIELNSEAHEIALENARLNKVESKLKLINGDASKINELDLGRFDRIVAPRPKGDDVPDDAATLAALQNYLKPHGFLHLYGFGHMPPGVCTNIKELKDPGEDMERLLSLAIGDDAAYEFRTALRCPRAPIGRSNSGKGLFRIGVDLQLR
mmetsp:Transcript_11234/g.24341  ORF Transcript_11234/g.24341 Transcript_11234/m.24341 type:complete len:365 (+) Transcript_11234:99-1193(+)